MQTKYNIGQTVTAVTPVFGKKGTYKTTTSKVRRIDIQPDKEGNVVTRYGGEWPMLVEEKFIASNEEELMLVKSNIPMATFE